MRNDAFAIQKFGNIFGAICRMTDGYGIHIYTLIYALRERMLINSLAPVSSSKGTQPTIQSPIQYSIQASTHFSRHLTIPDPYF